jgi:hypothetical protein
VVSNFISNRYGRKRHEWILNWTPEQYRETLIRETDLLTVGESKGNPSLSS